MDDLISRKEAIDQAMGMADYVDTIFDNPTESEIVYMLRSIPAVPAVPLDRLCKYMAVEMDCPPDHKKSDELCVSVKYNCENCWRHVLTELPERYDDENF